jgi:uncharacterized membrane protein
MTIDSETPVKQSWLPTLKSRWWTAVLGLSLMLNLLVCGILLGGFFGQQRGERLNGISYVQLMPRNFFRNLSGERRKELMQVVRTSREDLRALRVASQANSMKLAEVLEKDAFSIDEVRQTVTAFATGTESLAARGGEVVVQIVEKLTPEERKALAAAIRVRDARAKRQK